MKFNSPNSGRTGHVTLRDGRKLVYDEYGELDGGFPVLYFHGWPGARVEFGYLDADNTCKENGLRVIAIDRPGYGLSDDDPNSSSIKDFVYDVVQLVDLLEIQKFGILGYSGGGPFVYGSLCEFPADRLIKTVCIAGVAPFAAEHDCVQWDGNRNLTKGMSLQIRLMFIMGRRLSWLFKWMWNKMAEVPSRFSDGAARLPGPDGIYVSNMDPSIRQGLSHLIYECGKGGMKGCVRDAKLFSTQWYFTMKQVADRLVRTTDERLGKRVTIIHGAQDVNVPITMSRYVFQQLGDHHCELIEYEDDGHLSVSRHMSFALSLFAGPGERQELPSE